MNKLNPREQSLVDALSTRLVDADALQTDQILKEIEASDEYKESGHPDHDAYINMLPLALGRQMLLKGEDPHASANGMLDNQEFSYDIFPQEKPLDFSKEDREYKAKRAKAAEYINDINTNKITDPELSKQNLLDGAKDFLFELDQEQGTRLKIRETELKRMNAQESEWDMAEAKRRIQIKKDFMADRLKNVLLDDKKHIQELADIEWSNLQDAYGF